MDLGLPGGLAAARLGKHIRLHPKTEYSLGNLQFIPSSDAPGWFCRLQRDSVVAPGWWRRLHRDSVDPPRCWRRLQFTADDTEDRRCRLHDHSFEAAVRCCSLHEDVVATPVRPRSLRDRFGVSKLAKSRLHGPRPDRNPKWIWALRERWLPPTGATSSVLHPKSAYSLGNPQFLPSSDAPGWSTTLVRWVGVTS